jgi:hypothetical protein
MGRQGVRAPGDPNDIPRAVVNAAQRIHTAASLIRRLRSQVGDHRDLPAEVEAALQVLTAWATQQVVARRPGPAAAKKPPPQIEPGPLAARPRRRDAWRLRAP